MFKISIIIPVYNAEKTIKRAIDSVIKQSIGFNNLELLIVNDNSSDNSQDIIKQYADKYDNIIPINLNENHGGPAIPRNIGMENATAEYIMFLDNDDAFMKDYCETLYNVIIKEECDIVACKYSSRFLDGIYTPSNSSKEWIEVKDWMTLGFTMWTNIFKKSFIHEYEITCPNTGSEDGNFMVIAYDKAKKILSMPNYYGYVHTVESDDAQSLSHSTSINSFNKQIEGYNFTKSYFEENNLDKSRYFGDKIRNILFALFNFRGNKDQKRQILEKVYDFEMGLGYHPIRLKSKPLNFINKFILNKNFNIAIILISIANKMYNQRKIKNFIYKNFFGLKKLNIDD